MSILLLRLYALSLVSLTIFSYSFVDKNLVYLRPFIPQFLQISSTLQTVFYIGFITIFYTFYLIFLRKIQKNTLEKSAIFPLFLLTLGILFFSYPAMLSHDIFNYVATAKTFFYFHENPYIVMPIDFIGDPLLLFMHAANKTALYGPVWILLSGIPYVIGFGNFLVILFAFKAFISIFYIAVLALIYSMTRKWLAVAFFGLNPLVIFETLINSHNDIVMIFFALLSLFLLMKKKIILTLILISLSILIKFATLFLLPVFVLVLYKMLKKNKIAWGQIYLYCTITMSIILLLSPLREEMYPWYATWILSFGSLIVEKKRVAVVLAVLSFGLMLRYIPYMYLLTHFGNTPLLKVILTVVPLGVVFLWYLVKDKLWSKDILRLR